jgi:hypothetical protein
VYEPLAVPQLIDELFSKILSFASAISDPFRLRYRRALIDCVGEAIRPVGQGKIDDAGEVPTTLAEELVPEDDQNRFLKIKDSFAGNLDLKSLALFQTVCQSSQISNHLFRGITFLDVPFFQGPYQTWTFCPNLSHSSLFLMNRLISPIHKAF